MKITVEKSRLKGAVAIPASKSHTIRAVAIASLAAGESLIHNPLDSSDAQAAVSCYRALGARIDTSDPMLWKVGRYGRFGLPSEARHRRGNSGTTLRIAMDRRPWPGRAKRRPLTGDRAIQSPSGRTADRFAHDLGARAVSLRNNGKARVGSSRDASWGADGDCRFYKPICIEFAAMLRLWRSETPKINVTLLNEPGYVQMTLDWLDKQQIKYENEQIAQVCNQRQSGLQSFRRCVPADFSSATFFLCAAALVSDEVTLLGLDFADSQPDKAVVDYLRAMGADIRVGARFHHGQSLRRCKEPRLT